MKTLLTYIIESGYKNYRLNNVKVIYDCPKDLYIQVPNSFSEDNIQLYLDDRFLIDMPSGVNYVDEFFGTNADNIADVYFEYESCKEIENKKPDIEFDSKYNNDESEDDNLIVYHITNLKYVIIFDRFDILNGNDDNVKDTLDSIFNRTVSNNINEYPFEITLDTKNIEYSK